MLQISLQYDFYFLVCAYIVAKPYFVFKKFFTITLSNVIRWLQNFVYIVSQTM